MTTEFFQNATLSSVTARSITSMVFEFHGAWACSSGKLCQLLVNQIEVGDPCSMTLCSSVTLTRFCRFSLSSSFANGPTTLIYWSFLPSRKTLACPSETSMQVAYPRIVASPKQSITNATWRQWFHNHKPSCYYETAGTRGGGWKRQWVEKTFCVMIISPLWELLPTSGLHQLKGWTK